MVRAVRVASVRGEGETVRAASVSGEGECGACVCEGERFRSEGECAW